MHRTHVHGAQVFRTLEALHSDSRLVGVVKALTKEVERLDEENAQLYCTVMVYREVVRRQDVMAANTATPSTSSARDAA